MLFLWKRIIYFSRSCETRVLIQSPSFLLNLQPSFLGYCQCKKHFTGTMTRLGKDEIPSVLSKYELFSEETAPTILDVEEERQKVTFDDKTLDEFKGFNLARGVTGVFDVVEVVELLKKEKAEDIFVVKIPSEHRYVDHMVIVNGRSTRHMFAMCDFIRRLYKKKMSASDLIPKLEGKDSKTWMAIDLGNIVVHVFSKAGRQVYDLETLWSLGKDYDSLTQLKAHSSYDLSTDFAKVLASLSPDT